MLPTKFRVIWYLGLEEEAMNRFQDGCHLGFTISTILAIFDPQVTLMPSTKFRVNWPFSAGEEAKIDFQDGGHGGLLGFPIEQF